jgi:hypothetical protein
VEVSSISFSLKICEAFKSDGVRTGSATQSAQECGENNKAPLLEAKGEEGLKLFML